MWTKSTDNRRAYRIGAQRHCDISQQNAIAPASGTRTPGNGPTSKRVSVPSSKPDSGNFTARSGLQSFSRLDFRATGAGRNQEGAPHQYDRSPPSPSPTAGAHATAPGGGPQAPWSTPHRYTQSQGRDWRLRLADGNVATLDRLRVFAPRARHHRSVRMAHESSRIPLRITRLARDPFIRTSGALPCPSERRRRCSGALVCTSKLRISPDGPGSASASSPESVRRAYWVASQIAPPADSSLRTNAL